MAPGRKSTNEQEFQGEVLKWINAELSDRRLGLEKATQEKPRATSGKRNDLVVWKDRSSEAAFLELELKGPATALNDPLFFQDAVEKAQHWNAPYFAIWNMQAAELYRTPSLHEIITPADAIYRSKMLPVSGIEDWLKPDLARLLQAQALEILERAWQHSEAGADSGYAIDPEIFVARLSESLIRLRSGIYKALKAQTLKSRTLRRSVARIAVEQGFKGFVTDDEFAISGQMAYRLIGQILFYHALRRKQPGLKPLTIGSSEQIPEALESYWNEVRRYDYDALFKTEIIDRLIPLPATSQTLVRRLIAQLASYDWGSLSDDVLGKIFERLIPREEQVLLGQFYTPRPISDLLVALTVEDEWPTIVDPGCGSGTFLLSAYDYLKSQTRRTHSELLSTIWGFDLSPFATELSAINLFRQEMTQFDNFPRVIPGSFFERRVGETISFPPSRATSASTKIPVPVPQFRCVVGNPPYLRSQNQDDLDPQYRKRLFSAAVAAGISAHAKTDLFAFFVYHALSFMPVGARLGFVTPASWLTGDYAAALQKLLLGKLRLVGVVSSSAESFFPHVDINTVLLVAEVVSQDEALKTDGILRFITLKKKVAELTGAGGGGEYWERVIKLADEILDQDTSVENDRLRVTVVPTKKEKAGLADNPKATRNWSKFVRGPLSYFELFGDVA